MASLFPFIWGDVSVFKSYMKIITQLSLMIRNSEKSSGNGGADRGVDGDGPSRPDISDTRPEFFLGQILEAHGSDRHVEVDVGTGEVHVGDHILKLQSKVGKELGSYGSLRLSFPLIDDVSEHVEIFKNGERDVLSAFAFNLCLPEVRHQGRNLIAIFSYDNERMPNRTKVILELLSVLVETLLLNSLRCVDSKDHSALHALDKNEPEYFLKHLMENHKSDPRVRVEEKENKVHVGDHIVTLQSKVGKEMGSYGSLRLSFPLTDDVSKHVEIFQGEDEDVLSAFAFKLYLPEVRHRDGNLIAIFSYDDEEMPNRTSVIFELLSMLVNELRKSIL